MNGYEQKNLKISILKILVSLSFLSGFILTATATDVSGPMIISSPGIYNVVNDIGCNPIVNDSCIVITSSGVTLNGNGFTLLHGSGNTGIWIGGDPTHPSDVTIQNFKDIKGFKQGIESNGDRINVINNQFSNNYLGVSNPSNNSVISGNGFSFNTMGLWDAGVIGQNQIVNNNFAYNIDSLWYASTSGTIMNNTFIDNTNGIRVLNVSGRIYGSTYFYNNYLRNSNNIASFADISKFYWTNPDGPAAGTNVVGGPYIAGNYWSNPDGTGWSDMQPANILGYTTTPYPVVLDQYDTAPLVKTTNISHCPIIANFKADNTSGDYPLTINFTDLSTGIPDYWIWSFGDGALSTEQNPNHTYVNAGNYTVNLTAFYSECNDCKNITDYIQAFNHLGDVSGTNVVSDSSIASNHFSNSFVSSHQVLPSDDIRGSHYNSYQIVQRDNEKNFLEKKSNSCLIVANFSANKTSGNIPLTLNFTDLSTGNPDVLLWYFGDGNKSIEQNPNHTYLSTGNFSVNLSAFMSICKDIKTVENYINVTKPVFPPIANFAANQTLGHIPLSVQFTDQSTGNPNSWSWNFGDGGNSMLQHPVHTYISPGNYSVTLTVMNSVGSDKRVIPDYITAINQSGFPVANFTSNVTSGHIPLFVQFTDLSTGNPTSWLWEFGDGGNSIVQNPVHTYFSPGNYSVNVTVTNSAGSNKKVIPDYITATNHGVLPVANFTSNVTSGVVPLSVQFTDLSTGNPASWQWDFGDGGISSNQNPIHTYSSAGTYTVNITVMNTAGSDKMVSPDYITATNPVIHPIVTGIIPISGVVGTTVPFTVLGSNFVEGATVNLTYSGQNNISTIGSLSSPNLTGSFNIPASAVPNLWNVTVNQGGLYSNDDVRFEIIPTVINHIITSTAGTGGTISPSGAISVGHDTNQTFTISPNSGYQILDVLVDSESKGAVHAYTFQNVREDHTISAIFKKSGTYPINATSDPYTIIYPHGINNYPEGSTKTYLTQAKPGSDLLNVVVDEFISPPVDSWTYANITKDSNISTHGQYTLGQVHVLFEANQTVGSAPLAVSFTDHSIGDPLTYYWNFGDGSTSTLKNPEHIYQVKGTFTVTLRAINDQSGGMGVWNNAITVI